MNKICLTLQIVKTCNDEVNINNVVVNTKNKTMVTVLKNSKQ